ncbi:putative protein kinase RLK-Pelle-DLSV family [Helianthus debilis subsp. tardiflorus]
MVAHWPTTLVEECPTMFQNICSLKAGSHQVKQVWVGFVFFDKNLAFVFVYYLKPGNILIDLHRDLKAGNILIDLDMNPKISDFGVARRFHGQESEANTNKVVGTFYGVLLLEIVTGKKKQRILTSRSS